MPGIFFVLLLSVTPQHWPSTHPDLTALGTYHTLLPPWVTNPPHQNSMNPSAYYHTFGHFITVCHICCLLIVCCTLSGPWEQAAGVSCFSGYHTLRKQPPWWKGPQGEELRVTFGPQPARSRGPPSNNPAGTEFCQLPHFPVWPSHEISALANTNTLTVRLWGTIKQTTQLSHAWVSDSEKGSNNTWHLDWTC